MVKRFFCVLAMLLLFSSAKAEPTASVDRQVVSLNESFTLSIEFATRLTRNYPDLSSLEKDFEILSTTTGTRVEIINSTTESRTTLQVVLMPREVGSYQIPAMQVGNLSTRAIEITVRPASHTGQDDTGKAIFLETELSDDDVYVQGKLLFTLRLFHRVAIQEGTLSEPRLENALIERFGDDRTYNVSRDNQAYKVIERQYVIFPQKSGQFEIPSPTFRGRVPVEEIADTDDQFGKRGGFNADPFASFFRPTRLVQSTGPAQTINVKPIPENYPGSHWLVAEAVTLTDSWSPQPQSFKVGEPSTRTVTLQVKGVTKNQLPDVQLLESPNLNLYPDQPESQTTRQGNDIIATQTLRIAIVPSKSGPAEIAPIAVHWWDAINDQPRVTKIDAQTIAVQDQPNNEQTSSAETTLNGSLGRGQSTGNPNWLALALLFAIAWLTTLWMWIRERRQPKHLPVIDNTDASSYVETLRAHCDKPDARAARDAIIRWAERRWPTHKPLSLVGLCQLLGEHEQVACDALRALDAYLYSADTADWDAARLWHAMKPIMKRPMGKPAPRRDERLAKLHPA